MSARHEVPEEKYEVVWQPQTGPQTAFVHCPYDEILYGGARGGGKTDAVLGRFLIKALHYGKGVCGIAFRRTLPQLQDMIKRARELYGDYGEWKESTGTFHFDNGAYVIFKYLDNDDDAQNYQGWNMTDVIVEELTNFPDEAPIKKLRAILRSARGIPCCFMATANPGGPGMHWVRSRYIDPAPFGWKPIVETFEAVNPNTGKTISVQSTRIFIPARVWDNTILLNSDPGYIARLHEAGSENLVKAWLDGNWYVVDGAYLDFDLQRHVVRNFELPGHWSRYRCGDWGSARPFAFYWFAVASEGHVLENGMLIPKGALVFYREWYGIKTKRDGTIEANVGLKMFAEEVGAGLFDREKSDPKITAAVLDPSAFAQDGGPSIEHRIGQGAQVRARSLGFTKRFTRFRHADNKRVPGKGAMGGWDQLRGRLSGEEIEPERVLPDGTVVPAKFRPMIYFFETCVHAIRTLPQLQHDKNNLEDVDTDGEDHAGDAVRYGCMSRPYIKPMPKVKQAVSTLADVKFNDLWDTATPRGISSQPSFSHRFR